MYTQEYLHATIGVFLTRPSLAASLNSAKTPNNLIQDDVNPKTFPVFLSLKEKESSFTPTVSVLQYKIKYQSL